MGGNHECNVNCNSVSEDNYQLLKETREQSQITTGILIVGTSINRQGQLPFGLHYSESQPFDS